MEELHCNEFLEASKHYTVQIRWTTGPTVFAKWPEIHDSWELVFDHLFSLPK